MEPGEFWSTGDYAVVGDLWSAPGRDVVASLPVAGRDVVDLATGTGVTAIAAARAGAASVVGVDVTVSLLEEARRRADDAGLEIEWVEADVQDVPLPDFCADLVLSTVGLIFAADPQRAVAEARRLARAGGRVVFTSWSPRGLFGHVRMAMAEFFPDAPTPWHESAEGIRAVAGPEAQVEERTFELAVDSPEVFVQLMERHSAPILMATQTLGERWPEARTRLLDVIAAAGLHQDGAFRIQVPYLVTALEA